MTTNNEVQKPDDATLIVKRLLNATPERAYEAWTSPEHIKQWMRPEKGMEIRSAQLDLRVGGKFRIQMQMPDGEFFTAVGEFEEVQPAKRLVYTWDWEKDGSGDEFGEVEGRTTLLTVEFFPRGEQTEIVLTHARFAEVARRDSHAGGWDRIVESFAKAVEG